MRLRIHALAAMAMTAALAACGNKPPVDPQDYAQTIAEARAAKDADFQQSADPIPADKKSFFLPLSYYPVDPDYNVLAVLKESQDRPKFMMPTSTGQMRQMFRVGTLEFTVKGRQYTLGAFTEGDLRRLFVPFSDTTSGKETYVAGRFLDLDRTGTGIYALDFNRAYTPYCYYNASFDCPLPPTENRLKVPVTAGERTKPTE